MERNGKLTENARTLRKQMTKEEAKLWYQFLRLYRPRFHRQYVMRQFRNVCEAIDMEVKRKITNF